MQGVHVHLPHTSCSKWRDAVLSTTGVGRRGSERGVATTKL